MVYNRQLKKNKWLSWEGSLEKDFYEAEGTYIRKCPNWRIDDAPWKAEQVMRIFPLSSSNSRQGSISIADVGCGAGAVLAYLTDLLTQEGLELSEVHGYDLSGLAIDKAKELFPDLTFFCQDFLTVDKYYDYALVLDVVEHLKNPEEFIKTLKYKAAHVIFHVPCEDTYSIRFRNRYKYLAETIGHIHFFTPTTFSNLASSCGLSIQHWMYTPYFEQSWKRNKCLKTVALYLPRLLGKRLATDFIAKTIGQFEMLFLCRTCR